MEIASGLIARMRDRGALTAELVAVDEPGGFEPVS